LTRWLDSTRTEWLSVVHSAVLPVCLRCSPRWPEASRGGRGRGRGEPPWSACSGFSRKIGGRCRQCEVRPASAVRSCSDGECYVSPSTEHTERTEVDRLCTAMVSDRPRFKQPLASPRAFVRGERMELNRMSAHACLASVCCDRKQLSTRKGGWPGLEWDGG
jgi:hypothetical protein